MNTNTITRLILATAVLSVFASFASADMPMSGMKQPTDPALAKQIADLQSQVAALQVQMGVHNQHADGTTMAPPATASSGSMAMASPPRSAMSGMGADATPMQAGMSVMAAPPAGTMKMQGGGMGMMDMDKTEMAGMMGMMGGGSSMAMASTLPGFPGASHLYHIGATGFFLDHPQHIQLSTEQQTALNQIKERAALDKSSADRKVQEAEQELWKLTAADQPDAAQIEAKVRDIEKLRGEERIAFIRAVGDAAKVLTAEQRMALVGQAAAGTPAATTAAPAHQHKP